MFLATTALEEFWDKNKKILFLGEWCKLFHRKENWSQLDYIDFPYMWGNMQEIEQAIVYCDNVYERALEEITIALNRIHGLDKDIQYYRIVLGLWLLHFIHQTYDKYVVLQAVLDKYADIETLLLDNSQYYIPYSDEEIHPLASTDEYALQIYSQILIEMGYAFPAKTIGMQLTLKANRSEKEKMTSRRLFSYLNLLVTKLISFTKKKTVTVTFLPPLRHCTNFKLAVFFLKSSILCFFDMFDYASEIQPSFVNKELRAEIKISIGNNGFEKVLSSLIAQNLPMVFLERFKHVRKYILSLPVRKSINYLVSGNLQTNYFLTFYLAEYHNGINIYTVQHGGCYGINYGFVPERYERSISRRFYTWGWSDGENTKYLAYNKIQGRKLQYKHDGYVLVVMNSTPRYIYRFEHWCHSSNFILRYLPNLLEFLSFIPDNIKIKIRPRNIPQFGWEEKERIIEATRRMVEVIDSQQIPFMQNMKEARLAVFDNIYTTYLESLSRNTPTIIFCDKSVYRFRHEAQPFVDDLKKAKILHYTPESAAKHLVDIYDDVDKWWSDSLTQEARERFCYQFARQAKDWVDEFTQEMKNILNEV
ncbi:MAG: hypothetical protein HQK96_19345 [Nitrospirae bacterium]|nr:hypothetical protein [Nitrospirota bacterium]